MKVMFSHATVILRFLSTIMCWHACPSSTNDFGTLQAREVMTTDPSILEFQMERRVRPRLEAIKEAGMGTANLESEDNSDIDSHRPGALSLEEKLKVLGKFSDARFKKWLGRGSTRTSPRNDVEFWGTA